MGKARSLRDQRTEKLYALIINCYKDLTLLQRRDDPDGISTYVIGKPWSSAYRTEVYVGRSHITVQGDIDLMSFGGGPRDHRERIGWLAHATNGYLSQKANIGCTSTELVYEYELDIARKDLLEERRFGNISAEQARAGWDSLRHDERPQQATHEIYEIDYAESIDLGRVMSNRVITAHVAVQRLDVLLDEADGRGPVPAEEAPVQT